MYLDFHLKFHLQKLNPREACVEVLDWERKIGVTNLNREDCFFLFI